MSDEKKLSIPEVIDYMEETFNKRITRQTVYNWMNKGVRGRKLQYGISLGRRYTTELWLNGFLASL